MNASLPEPHAYGTVLLDTSGVIYRARRVFEPIDPEQPPTQDFSVLHHDGAVSRCSNDELPTTLTTVWTPNPVCAKLLEAGVIYPANWDEMGSSEKDMWEDNMLSNIENRRNK